MFQIDTGFTLRNQVNLDGSRPALRPCRFCGSTIGYLTGPSGPHDNGVRCECCKRHLGWLSKPPPLFDDDDFDVIE